MSLVQKVIRLLPLVVLLAVLSCQTNFQSTAQTKQPNSLFPATSEKPKLADINSVEVKKLLESAIEQTNLTKNYDPAYVVIPYPNGDIPVEKGVCTDVVIRAFRRAGVDLR